MASKQRVIEGSEVIVFTSRSQLNTITLKAEPGKQLVLDGTSGGGGGGSADLSTEKTTTELGFYEVSNSATTLTSSDPDIDNQGIGVDVSADGNYIVTSGPNVPDIPGGVVYFDSGSGSVEQFTFESAVGTSSTYAGQRIAINEDGTAVAMQSRYNGGAGSRGTDFFRRTGTTWTKTDTGIELAEYEIVGLSGDYSLTSWYYGNELRVLKYDGSNYVQDVTLLTDDYIFLDNSDYYITTVYWDIGSLNGIKGSPLVAFRGDDPVSITVWTRSGSTWTRTAKLFEQTKDTYTAGRAVAVGETV